MTDPIKSLIAAGYRATMWLDGKGLSDEGVAVLGDLRSALDAIAAAEARPEPAAEPIEFGTAMREAERYFGEDHPLIVALEALAREVRE